MVNFFKKDKDIVLSYNKKQGYYTMFNKNTGMFIRCEYKGKKEPFWDERGPELLDICITNWCDKGCSFCYRKSSINGKHMSLETFEEIMKQASSAGVFQIALGGGNPNQHPQFCEFLKLAREKYGIVPSYTTNGTGLSNEILEATKKYCGAVAVSMYKPYSKFKIAIDKLIAANIKTNVHYMLSSESIDQAIDLLSNPQQLKNVNAITFLNYKPIGRKKSIDLLLNKNKNYKVFFEILKDKKFPFKIGFDSCSISGVLKYLNIDSKYIESCEAARFSGFISEDMNFYPCSFMEGLCKGYDLRKYTIKNVWEKGTSFKKIRNNIQNNKCKDMCYLENICRGGCPIFNEINLCDNMNSNY